MRGKSNKDLVLGMIGRMLLRMATHSATIVLIKVSLCNRT